MKVTLPYKSQSCPVFSNTATLLAQLTSTKRMNFYNKDRLRLHPPQATALDKKSTTMRIPTLTVRLQGQELLRTCQSRSLRITL